MSSEEPGVVDSAQSDRTPQWRRGVLELCVLKLLGEVASYGYEIVTTLNNAIQELNPPIIVNLN